MVLLVAGAVRPQDVIDAAQNVCGEWTARSPRPERRPPPTMPQNAATLRVDRFQQQALALAYPAPSSVHEDRHTADVLASILGGHNSRFFWNIVQAGIAPHVSAGRVEYCDVGMMLAFGMCEPSKTEQLLETMRTEIGKLARDGVTKDEVQRVINRVRTSLATEAEAPYYRLMQLIHDVDVLGRPRSVSERLAELDAVTVDRARAYLAAWPLAGEGSLTSLGPRDWPGAGH
jgi:predicted Zn-dependent peptidase